MPRLLAFLFCVLAAAAQSPSKLGYGLIVTGGAFTVTTTGTNVPTLNGARILTTNDLGGAGGTGETTIVLSGNTNWLSVATAGSTATVAITARGTAAMARAETDLMSVTGTASRVQLGQFVVNTNKITLTDAATSFSIFAGEERGLGQGTVGAFITGYRTNSGTTPGTLSMGTPGVTGSVRISAAEYVGIENARFDGDAISNSAGVLTMDRAQFRNWETSSIPLSAGLTNRVTINPGQGPGVINEYDGRLDLRSYWGPPLMVFRELTNMQPIVYIGQSTWAHSKTDSGAVPSNLTVFSTWGPHPADKAIYGAAVGSIARGTNDGVHDLILMTSDSATNLAERARLTSEGNFELKGGKYIGDGSALTGITSTASSPIIWTTNSYSDTSVTFAVPSNSNPNAQELAIRFQCVGTNGNLATMECYLSINGRGGTGFLNSIQYEYDNTTIAPAKLTNTPQGMYLGSVTSAAHSTNSHGWTTMTLWPVNETNGRKRVESQTGFRMQTSSLTSQMTRVGGWISLGDRATSVTIIVTRPWSSAFGQAWWSAQ